MLVTATTISATVTIRIKAKVILIRINLPPPQIKIRVKTTNPKVGEIKTTKMVKATRIPTIIRTATRIIKR